MGKYESTEPNKKALPWILAAVALVVVVLAIVLILPGLMKNNASPQPGQTGAGSGAASSDGQALGETAAGDGEDISFQVIVTEQGDEVIVETPYCAVSYPSAFSDVVRVNTCQSGGGNGLEFRAEVAGKNLLLYTLWFGSDLGDALGTLEIADGDAIRVSIDMIAPPADLIDSDLDTFYAAQETINDVIQSLSGNDEFFGM